MKWKILILLWVVQSLRFDHMALAQERYALDAEAYCEERLIRHLHTG